MNVRIFFPGAFLCVAVAPAQNPTRIQLVPWATDLPHVTDIAHCGDDRLFAVRQDGYISIVTDSMSVLPTPFLDIHDSVLYEGEQGLLGLAFDPGYDGNGYFYVNYVCATGGTHSRISRFSVTNDPNVADPASEEILYTVSQPYVNHKGGDLDFGPDGFLYVAFGDGGATGDPENHAQNLADPLGDIIRIDVSGGGSAYAVPPSNPFINAGADTLPEIWASGLRNPFRFGFDQLTGDLWIGDVGQSAWEEIDHWPAGDNSGPNFGWRCYEGMTPYNINGCAAVGAYVDPVTVHVNDGNLGQWCAIIGGRVYRGAQWPHLFGRYLYTDYCLGDFWSLKEIAPGQWFDEMVMDTTYGWSCIVENVHGELFTGHLDQGTISKIVDHCPMEPPVITYNGTLITTPADAYQWYLDNLPIPDATGETHVPVANGSYHVVADFGNGCILNSDTLMVIDVGIPEVEATLFTLDPDPATDHISISWNSGSRVQEIRIIDPQGRTVLKQLVRTGTRVDLATGQLTAGVHLVQLRSADGLLATRRFVVVH